MNNRLILTGTFFKVLAVLIGLPMTTTVLVAHEGEVTEDPILEEVVVEGRRENLAGEARSASEGVIGQENLALRPLLRPGDVLESIPGLIVTQHSGSGKSNQMFLRGFNLDHGTDFATWIDGMPVNKRTHGHGQGYTDINFLIPETVRTMDYVKGPYHSELGDFSSAGGTHIRLANRFDRNEVRVGMGENGYGRLLALGGADMADGHLMGVIEGQVYDGPWTDISENVEKKNGLLRWSAEKAGYSYQVTGMYYDNEWDSADQIPQRAVDQGLIDEFGSLDTSLGGKTRRISLSAAAQIDHENSRTEVDAYIIDYRLNLWSNFTYLLDDPVNGDQFEQLDDRTVYGGSWRRMWAHPGGWGHFHHTVGVDFRHDDIGAVGLFKTRDRQRVSTVRLDTVDETSIGAWYELEWRFRDQWRAVAGLRGDYYWFDNRSAGVPENSGDGSDGLVSPKGSLIYSLSDTTELYASAGLGFHSNDARGVTITVDPVSGEPVDQVDPLVRSKGAEVGFRTMWLDSWNMSLAVWSLDLDSELLFVGDAGTTEASRPSTRWGIEFNNFWAITDIWSLEADFAWTDARFEDDAPEGNLIPGAIETVMTGALTGQWPSGWFGTAEIRYFDGAPLIEDGSVTSQGSTMANLALGWSSDTWRIQLDVLNLFDSNDRDIEYFYASRLAGEPPDGIEDIHYHVFEPRQVRVYASWYF